MKKGLFFFCIFFFLLLTNACVLPADWDMLPTVPPELIPSELPRPTLTIPPEPTMEAAPTSQPEPSATTTASPTPFIPFQAVIADDKVNLRANPGLLFDIVTMVEKDTPLTVIGRTLGSEWMLVETDKHKRGWMAADFIWSEIPLSDAPIANPERVIVIQGRVVDKALNPVVGLRFNIAQTSESSKMHNEAVTDESGTFYAYMPSGIKGSWLVSYMGAVCSSPLMDDGCTCKKGSCGLVKPISTVLTLPQKNPLVFIWE